MSAFAVFSLKDPSLLAFDERRKTDGNLKRVYGLEEVPCDTQMRTTLDEVEPSAVKSEFKDVFRELQRGKELEKFVFMEGCYLLSLDGTGYFSSKKIHCDSCLEEVNKKQQIPFSGCLPRIYTPHKPQTPQSRHSMRVSDPREQETSPQIGILTSPILPNGAKGYPHDGEQQ